MRIRLQLNIGSEQKCLQDRFEEPVMMTALNRLVLLVKVSGTLILIILILNSHCAL